MGGICAIGPVKRGRTASNAARSTVTGWVSSVSPDVSWVLVTSPSRRPAIYSFSPFSANSTARVACPTNTGRTPVAIGSNVPPWPTRFSFRIPRILAQTSMLVQPEGLSIITMPLAIGGSSFLEIRDDPGDGVQHFSFCLRLGNALQRGSGSPSPPLRHDLRRPTGGRPP